MNESYLQYLMRLWFGTDSNTSATIIITFIIFILGFFLTYVGRGISDMVKRKNTRKIFNYNLKRFAKAVNKQSRYYSFYANSLTFYSHGFAMSTVVIPELNVFQEIGYQNIFSAFFRGPENIKFSKRKLVAFQMIWRSIIAIPKWQEDVKTSVYKHLETHNKWNEDRNENLGAYRHLIDQFLSKVNGETVPRYLGEYCQAVDKVYSNYQKTPDFQNPVTTETTWVLPVLEINRAFPKIPEIHEFNTPLLAASLAYTNMKNYLLVQQDLANQFEKAFTSHYKLLKLCSSYLNK